MKIPTEAVSELFYSSLQIVAGNKLGKKDKLVLLYKCLPLITNM